MLDKEWNALPRKGVASVGGGKPAAVRISENVDRFITRTLADYDIMHNHNTPALSIARA